MNVDIHIKVGFVPTGAAPVPAAAADAPAEDSAEAVVTPWTVTGAVDYDKLIRDFGSQAIDQAMLQRIERLTGRPAHPFLRRGLFFSHRDMNRILDLYEAGKPFYLYTGRGPSSDSMHMGHLIPFLFTKYLQDVFRVPLVVQITDDEKFLWKDISQEKMEVITRSNIRDIIALGFDRKLTFIFQDYNYFGHMYRVVSRIQRAIPANQVRGAFGFKMEDNIGKWMFPAVQAAPSFSDAFPHIFPPKSNVPCLIPCAIDQDPYFRLTRDIARPLGWVKPALIHAKFFPALGGVNSGKMGASIPSSAIFLTDTPKQIKEKITKHAFSGGGATKEEQLFLGANVDVDVPVQWLNFFLDDDAKLAQVRADYATGRMMTGEVKALVTECVTKIVVEHQEARKLVTDAVLDSFMSTEKMDWKAPVPACGIAVPAAGAPAPKIATPKPAKA